MSVVNGPSPSGPLHTDGSEHGICLLPGQLVQERAPKMEASGYLPNNLRCDTPSLPSRNETIRSAHTQGHHKICESPRPSSFLTPTANLGVPMTTLRFDNLLGLAKFTESCYSLSVKGYKLKSPKGRST